MQKTPHKQRGAEKTARIPIKVVTDQVPLKKPQWIRAKSPTHPKVNELKKILNQYQLKTVCQEASCPNLGECFAQGTATFMIMGELCTRRCPFCDVAHGRPKALDSNEPQHLAHTIAKMKLSYVVITSVDRDDLRDGGAQHFVKCIQAIRIHCPTTQIEILTPDFRGRMDKALDILYQSPPDIFNHNLETVPRLYPQVRPGADYQTSLQLLQRFTQQYPNIPSKSGLMLGVGETDDEIIAVMEALRQHHVSMLTLGQYLQPGKHHLPVQRYISPTTFQQFAILGKKMGFKHVASAPMVRSSYHADQQAHHIQ